MASAATGLRRAAPVQTGYHRLVVPISGSADSESAVEIACSLAAEHGAVLTAAFVIEVSPLLPLDARMDEDTARARAALLRAEAIADAFGVRVQGRKIRAREAWRAIVELAGEEDAEIIVIAAPRKRRVYGSRIGFGSTVRHVLAKAPCRVLVVAPRPSD